jgi:hypothetical protein
MNWILNEVSVYDTVWTEHWMIYHPEVSLYDTVWTEHWMIFKKKVQLRLEMLPMMNSRISFRYIYI